ncbi:hypothetical protein QYE76_069951 [Lolium multiflorum]|uniref:Uncharacterized protein n=1 Tax=Lolium multiflorum TaxID=4521 RepID=A0AAD8SHC1_LOLMU|nr:hypothetical protein QYE76_069951 [Lolium multiflorum]
MDSDDEMVALLLEDEHAFDDNLREHLLIIASLQDMLDEAEKREEAARRIKAGKKEVGPGRMEGHAMLHNDYFADGATHADNFSEACRKDVERAFGVLQAQFAIVRYPALSWSHDQMWEVMQACVIMHNMIIEDDRKNHVRSHVGPYECQGPLAEVDHELPADFLAMHAEIRDSNVHEQLQADLVEHLWRIKGNTVAP